MLVLGDRDRKNLLKFSYDEYITRQIKDVQYPEEVIILPHIVKMLLPQ